MGDFKNRTCGLEYAKEFTEYPEYPYFTFYAIAFSQFKKTGALPFPGSLSEQPAQSMEIIETLMELDSEHQVEMEQRAKKDK